MVVNHHDPEDCEAIGQGLERPPARLKGKAFYCPCAYGEHAFYMILEGTSAGEVLTSLPPSMRPGTTAVQIEVLAL